ncbi:hypothetical protein [Salinicola sp. CR57]|uniref:hypothetical protein n=1 Tax=Salinicola sp. CR57 TaxID=1949086 RepID=UPI001300720F|nr:hypothetical protein [Salinicola sp. CR57]
MFDYNYTYSSGIKVESKEIEGYYIDYIAGDLSALVVTFENANNPHKPRLNKEREAWGAKYLNNKGYAVLAIKPKKVDWYRGASLHAFFRSYSLKSFLSNFHKVFFYGSSMGGYAALAFSRVCPESTVIAFNPQSTLHPELVPWETRYEEGRAQDWGGDFYDAKEGLVLAKKVYVVYDPFFELDRKHVERLDGQNVIRFQMPFVGHVVSQWMRDAGILDEFVTSCLSNDLTATDIYALSKYRRTLSHYYYNLANRSRSLTLAEYCAKSMLSLGLTLRNNYHDEFERLLASKNLWYILRNSDVYSMVVMLGEDRVTAIAKKALDSGFPLEALKLCESYTMRADPSSRVFLVAAESLCVLGELQQAKVMASRCITRYPNKSVCHRVLSRIHRELGDYILAYDAANMAFNLSPNVMSHIELTVSCYYLGRLEEAETILDVAVNKWPKNTRLKVLRGSISKEKLKDESQPLSLSF